MAMDTDELKTSHPIEVFVVGSVFSAKRLRIGAN